MLAYKTSGGTKNFKKLVHLSLQFLRLCLSVVGSGAVLKVHIDKGTDNFYSLHSWLGLASLILFSIQVFYCSNQLSPSLRLFVNPNCLDILFPFISYLLYSAKLRHGSGIQKIWTNVDTTTTTITPSTVGPTFAGSGEIQL